MRPSGPACTRPLADIAHVSRINGVVVRGRLFNRAALTRLVDEVSRAPAASRSRRRPSEEWIHCGTACRANRSVTTTLAASANPAQLGDTVVFTATRDVAGNATKRSVTFEVVATLDSLMAAVDTFTSGGSIDPNTAGALLAKLDEARQAIARGNVTVGEHKLQEFINQVNVKIGRGVAPEAADVLVTDARFVLATM